MNKLNHPINGEPCVICANRATHTWTERLTLITIRLTQLAEQIRLDVTGSYNRAPSDFTASYERLGQYRGRLAYFQGLIGDFVDECPDKHAPEMKPAARAVFTLFCQAYRNWRALSDILDAHWDYWDAIQQFHADYEQRLAAIMDHAGAR